MGRPWGGARGWPGTAADAEWELRGIRHGAHVTGEVSPPRVVKI